MPTIKINWSQWDHLLGVESDRAISEVAGCTDSNVRHRRKKLGIKPAIYSSWSDEDQVLLDSGFIQCARCNDIKSKNSFHKEDDRISRTGTRRICKDCVAKNRRNKWLRTKTKYTEILGGKCQKCGFCEFLSPLQFHHVLDNEKEHTLSIIMMRESRTQDVIAELDKCCLLCSNCHDAFHASELDLKFKKRESIGWTVASSEDALDFQNCPTEDMGFTNSSVKDKNEHVQ
jgi:hypothetical protein